MRAKASSPDKGDSGGMGKQQPNRLPRGGRIDRSQPLTFHFNNRACQGYAGDTLASALLANGIDVIGRSFKYHRPRGIMGSGMEEPNAIIQVGVGADTVPNLRATEVALYDGLTASTVRGWPGLDFDLLAINDFCHRLLSAGFYYKTFMQPGALWKWYERCLRKASGLGVSPQLPDPDRYTHRNAHCDVLVVGAGPAGLMAALAAAKSGARVIIADEQSEFGGSLLYSAARVAGNSADEWLGKALTALADCPEVVLLPCSTVFGYYDYNFLTILERCRDRPAEPRQGLSPSPPEGEGSKRQGEIRQRLWRVRAKRVILATGAIERPLVFPNNDRPGVMLASAVSHYIHRYGVCPGRRGLIFANNDSACQAALDLAAAGAAVAAVVDCRAAGAGAIADAVEQAGIDVFRGHVITGVTGRKRVRSVQVTPVSADGKTLNGASKTIACDLVAMSGGWSPAVHLHSQAGGGIAWSEAHACFIPDKPGQDNVSVGAGNGSFALDACLAEGQQAGLDAARQCGFEPVPFSTPKTGPTTVNPLQPLWRTPALQSPERSPKQFLDYQNDTTVTDVRLAVREGFQNVEHVKRYTALGFGTDQGKLGNINGMAALAERLDKPIAEVGTTTFRPPYTPVAFGACAGMDVGQLYEPVRKTPLHDWHEAAGAEFEVVGQWLRPWYFPRAGEDRLPLPLTEKAGARGAETGGEGGDRRKPFATLSLAAQAPGEASPGEDLREAVARECLAARNSLAIMDASTLGKIEVQGPDAVAFLECIYTHNVAGMKIGRCAYGIMLGEDGMLMDDGVMARLGERHFYLTTTTGGAAGVLHWLEQWLQTEWPELKVYLTSVTERWATIALVGPNSRKLLQGLNSDIAFDQADFPFMSVRSGVLAGFAVQVFRVSFSGELAFEINVESDEALALWRKLMEAGGQYDITPYGTETMHVLRAEKGFVIVGQDTDGSVSPVDLGMNWLLTEDKDYLGKRSLARPDCRRADRKQWVGLLSEDGTTVLPEGTQLVEANTPGGRPPRLPIAVLSKRSRLVGKPGRARGRARPIPMVGHVTSSYYSACLGHPIALALVSAGRARKGDHIHAALSDGRYVKVKIVSPVFYDPKGERQHV